MAKRFYSCSLDQPLLLAPDLRDWLPPHHLARFLADLVSRLDLRAIYADYQRRDGRGHAGYHPEMLTRVLFYAYAIGETSSRAIEQATYESLPFRFLATNQQPDHTVLSAFRQRHLAALADLFVQVLQICDKAGLVTLGHIAIDGTKILANATKRRSVSFARLSEREQYWYDRIETLLAEAQQTDAREQTAAEQSSAPRLSAAEQIAQAQQRLAEIWAAQQVIEQEAQKKLAEKTAAFAPLRGRKGQTPPAERDPVAYKRAKRAYYRARKEAAAPTRSYNFTDPDSRLMKDGATHATVQAYNAQAAVDEHSQIIVAATVTQDEADCEQLAPMVAAVEKNMGRRPAVVTADKGYWDTTVIVQLLATVDGQTPLTVLVPPERDPAQGPTRSSPQNATATAMRERLTSDQGRAQYGRRQGTVEPVFGETKEQRGFRRFSFRGRVKNDAEWRLICLTHNVRKLHRAWLAGRYTPAPTPNNTYRRAWRSQPRCGGHGCLTRRSHWGRRDYQTLRPRPMTIYRIFQPNRLPA